MSKLNINAVTKKMLRESEEVRPSYTSLKSPKPKMAPVSNVSDPSRKVSKIKQVEVPKNHKSTRSNKKSKTQKGGIPQAGLAGDIIDKLPVYTMSAAKNEKSPTTPKIVRNKANQQSKSKLVTGAIKNTDGGKASKSSIPTAKMADTYTAKMSRGNGTMGGKRKKDTPMKVPTAATLKTSAKSRVYKTKPQKTDNQKVSQVSHTGKFSKTPSDAPKAISVAKAVKGHNVMESVQIVINGNPKASFGVIHKDVVAKLVETYKGFGYSVDLVRAKSSWKTDKALIHSVFESVDAHYNNAPKSSRSARKAAMNRFFAVSQKDYNSLYESRQQFTQTVKAAFERIMEQADLKYRKSLMVLEGVVRIESNGETIDLDLITQAKNTEMALRNFRNEVIEEYGFGTTIKHIFVEGEKYTPSDIIEWSRN